MVLESEMMVALVTAVYHFFLFLFFIFCFIFPEVKFVLVELLVFFLLFF